VNGRLPARFRTTVSPTTTAATAAIATATTATAITAIPAAAITTAAATTKTTSAAAAAGATLTWPGFINSQHSPIEFFTIELLNCRRRFFVI
jgi:hypothetical protein